MSLKRDSFDYRSAYTMIAKSLGRPEDTDLEPLLALIRGLQQTAHDAGLLADQVEALRVGAEQERTRRVAAERDRLAIGPAQVDMLAAALRYYTSYVGRIGAEFTAVAAFRLEAEHVIEEMRRAQQAVLADVDVYIEGEQQSLDRDQIEAIAQVLGLSEGTDPLPEFRARPTGPM